MPKNKTLFVFCHALHCSLSVPFYGFDPFLHQFPSTHSVGQGEVGGQGKVGGVTHSVLCISKLLCLAVKGPWLAPGGSILTWAA